MKAHRITRDALDPVRLEGMVLCEDVRDSTGRPALKKGQVIGGTDLPTLDALEWTELHVIERDRGELLEEDAGRHVAGATAGDGTTVGTFSGGHWAITATRRGVLEVEVDTLAKMNRIEGLCVYTLYDGQIVDAGELVARAKITPFVLRAEAVDRAEELAREGEGIVRVKEFRPARIAAVVQERLDERALGRFRQVLGEKAAWFGASLDDVRVTRADADAVADAIGDVVRLGAQVIVMAGTRAMDPLDPAFVALDRLGAPLERYGVPAHPGSLLWLARLGDTPVVGMPACGLFSQATTFDLVFPRLLAGQEVSRDSLADLGHGGLLTKDLSFRFPRYRETAARGEVE
jgi:hypothetical protein